jgi:acetyltransferase-like isoleucine patch superfamily enzyme
MNKELFRKALNFPGYLRKRSYWYLSKIAKSSVLLSTLKIPRSAIWRITGCNVGKNVRIGWEVYYDVSNANLIFIEDDVWIASRALILCHRRDMSVYYKNERYMDLPYIRKPVTIKKGACVSMGAVIMPGVTVGEGAVVGAGAIVTKDVPPWTIVAGNPARVIKEVKLRNDTHVR